MENTNVPEPKKQHRINFFTARIETSTEEQWGDLGGIIDTLQVHQQYDDTVTARKEDDLISLQHRVKLMEEYLAAMISVSNARRSVIEYAEGQMVNERRNITGPMEVRHRERMNEAMQVYNNALDRQDAVYDAMTSRVDRSV
jgi:hypothetical protein